MTFFAVNACVLVVLMIFGYGLFSVFEGTDGRMLPKKERLQRFKVLLLWSAGLFLAGFSLGVTLVYLWERYSDV